MKNKLGKKFLRSPLSENRMSVRYFIDYPDGGWKRVGEKRLLDILRAKIALPELADKVVRVATADVEMEDSKIVSLERLHISEWQLDNRGLVDRPQLMKQFVAKLNNANVKAILSQEDILAIKGCMNI
jgi:ABC-type phosphonate transport system ATPase subunit